MTCFEKCGAFSLVDTRLAFDIGLLDRYEQSSDVLCRSLMNKLQQRFHYECRVGVVTNVISPARRSLVGKR